MLQKVKNALCDMGHEDAIIFENPDYAEAVVGVTDEGRVIYDFDLMVKHLVEKDDMGELEAIEFIEYNTIRALPYAGENAPIILYKLML